MAGRLYAMKKETVQTVMAHNDMLSSLSGELGGRYDIRPEFVIVLSGFLHRKQARGTSASKAKLEALCAKLRDGAIMVESRGDDWVLFRAPDDSIGEKDRSVGKWPRRIDPMGAVLYVLMVAAGVLSVAAICYVLWALVQKYFM